MTAIEFNYQVTSFSDKLKAFAISLTHNNEDAEDLLQDTILKALKYRDKFTASTNLKAWLCTIMKNTFINNYRRLKLSKTILDDSPSEYNLHKPAAENTDPDRILGYKEVLNYVENLHDDLRIPFEKFLVGFKYKEIADELNLPLGTVKSRIFLARKELMFQLQGYN